MTFLQNCGQNKVNELKNQNVKHLLLFELEWEATKASRIGHRSIFPRTKKKTKLSLELLLVNLDCEMHKLGLFEKNRSKWCTKIWLQWKTASIKVLTVSAIKWFKIFYDKMFYDKEISKKI